MDEPFPLRRLEARKSPGDVPADFGIRMSGLRTMDGSRRWLLWAFLGLLLSSSSGCVALLAGGAAGAAGYAYAKGSTVKVYPVSKEDADRAVQNTVANLQVTVLKHDSDITGSRTEAKTAHGKKFTIETRSVGSASEVKVRVGTFGDEAWTDMIFAQLNQQLGTPEIREVETVPADPQVVPVVGTGDNPTAVIPAVNSSQ